MKARSVRIQAVMMIALTAITQVLGILRMSVVGATFGASREYDAFAVTLTVASSIVGVLSSALSNVIIPALVQGRDRRGTDAFLTTVCVIALGFAGVTWLFCLSLEASPVADSLSSYGRYLLTLAPMTASSQALGLVSGAAVARLQAERVFALPQFINTLGAAIVVAAAFLDPKLTIQRYAAWILGSAVLTTAAMMLLAQRRGAPFSVSLAAHDPQFRALVRVYLPTSISTSVYQLSLVVDSLISSHLGPGNATMLAWSLTVSAALSSVLLGPLSAMSMPSIAAAVGRSTDQGIRMAARVAGMRCAVAVISVSLFLVAGHDAIALVYLHGVVTEQNITVVTWCTNVLVIILPVGVVRDVLYQHFIAHRDTITPFQNSIIASVVNLVSSVLLSIPLGVYGVVLGTAVTGVFSTSTLLWRAHRRWHLEPEMHSRARNESLRLLCAGFFSVAGGWILLYLLPSCSLIVEFIVGCTASSLICVVLLALMGSQSFRAVLPKRVRSIVRS